MKIKKKSMSIVALTAWNNGQRVCLQILRSWGRIPTGRKVTLLLSVTKYPLLFLCAFEESKCRKSMF
jgi:hypothetical protein